jgi:hypothetical protein
MMKYKPYAVVGILFVVLFLITVYAFQCGGVWNPPGNRAGEGNGYHGDHEGHDDHNETINNAEIIENETEDIEYISDTLRGSFNLQAFLEDNDIPVDCVSEKLGLTNAQLDDSAGDIKDALGIEMSDIRTAIDTCLGFEPREFEHDEEGNHTGNDLDTQTLYGGNDNEKYDSGIGDGEGKQLNQAEQSEHINEQDRGQGLGQNQETDRYADSGTGQGEGLGQGSGSGKGQGLGSGSGLASNNGNLMGKDNVSEYCKTNNIPLESVAVKLGISEEQLSKQAGKLAKELGMEMFDLREIILSCQ